MQQIINFVTKFKEFITFASLVIISLSLISINNTNQLGGFRTLVIAGMGNIQDAFAWIPNPGAMLNENRALRELNLQLSTEVVRMRSALIENERLRKMLALSEVHEKILIAADVVGIINVEMRSYVTINKGIREGINRGMPVRTDAGLVGSIIGTSENYSVIETINNRHIKIASLIQRSGVQGILTWHGQDEYLLTNIPNTYDVQIGDVLVTSQFSKKYPSDLPIGQVIDINEDLGSLFYKINVMPFANLRSLEQVFIVKYIPDPERIELIEEIEKMIMNRPSVLR